MHGFLVINMVIAPAGIMTPCVFDFFGENQQGFPEYGGIWWQTIVDLTSSFKKKMYCRFIGLFKLQKLDESKVGYRENNNSWVSAMVKIGVWLRLIRLLLPRYPNQSMQRDIAPTDDIDTRDTCKKHRRTHDIAKKLKVTMSYDVICFSIRFD